MPDDPHALVHALRGTLDEEEAWRAYRCDFCGRAPTSQEDAYDWAPLSGDTWCCQSQTCNGELADVLKGIPMAPQKTDRAHRDEAVAAALETDRYKPEPVALWRHAAAYTLLVVVPIGALLGCTACLYGALVLSGATAWNTNAFFAVALGTLGAILVNALGRIAHVIVDKNAKF